jgi:ATP-dependent Clp protease ATP-binding subunit ClpA
VNRFSPLRMIREFRTIGQLLGGAERHAQAAGAGLPGAEHLLLAALALPDGTARRAFERAGVDPDRLASASGVAAVSAAPTASATRRSRVFRATPEAQAAFRRAVDLSATPRPRRLLGAHIVIAVCEVEFGAAVRALGDVGLDRERLVAAARAELAAAGA